MDNNDFLKNKIRNDELTREINSEEIFEKILSDVEELKRMLHIKSNFKKEDNIKHFSAEDETDSLINDLESFNLARYGQKYKNPYLVDKWVDDQLEPNTEPVKEKEPENLNLNKSKKTIDTKKPEGKYLEVQEEEFVKLGIYRLKINRKLIDKDRSLFKKIETFAEEFENNYGVNFFNRVAQWIKEEEELYSKK